MDINFMKRLLQLCMDLIQFEYISSSNRIRFCLQLIYIFIVWRKLETCKGQPSKKFDRKLKYLDIVGKYGIKTSEYGEMMWLLSMNISTSFYMWILWLASGNESKKYIANQSWQEKAIKWKCIRHFNFTSFFFFAVIFRSHHLFQHFFATLVPKSNGVVSKSWAQASKFTNTSNTFIHTYIYFAQSNFVKEQKKKWVKRRANESSANFYRNQYTESIGWSV